MSKDPESFMFTPAEAAYMSGCGSGEFAAMVEMGIVQAEPRSGNWLIDGQEVYRLIRSRFPIVQSGKARMMTCGQHTFMATPEMSSCPGLRKMENGPTGCGRPIRPANTDEVISEIRRLATVRTRRDSKSRRCLNCGRLAKMGRYMRVCEDCLHLRKKSGSRSQNTWNGRRHTCCGSRVSWRHRIGCKAKNIKKF